MGSNKKVKEMSKDYLQQKLGEFIYVLGEINFDVIKTDSWHKYINEQEEFTDKQIDEFRLFLESIEEDIRDNKYL